MKKTKPTETQIIGVLPEQEAGGTTDEVCRRHGIVPQGGSDGGGVAVRRWRGRDANRRGSRAVRRARRG